jgi:hypothetical protein
VCLAGFSDNVQVIIDTFELRAQLPTLDELSHTEAYRRFTDDPTFRAWLCERLFSANYPARSAP